MLGGALEKAARLTPAQRKGLALLRGDFRELPFQASFSLAISPFNTLQHITDASELSIIFRSLRECVHEGGYFAFDVMRPPQAWLAEAKGDEFSRRRLTHPRTQTRMTFSARRNFDPVSRVVVVRMNYVATDQDEAPTEIVVAHRQYGWDELATVLRATGWTPVSVLGGFSGEPLGRESESIVVVSVARSSDPS